MVLLKNLRVAQGLANGTRLTYEGPVAGNSRKLWFRALRAPRRRYQLGACLSACKLKSGRRLKRLQFPMRLAYSVTVHKCQGQTCQRLGIYMAAGTTMLLLLLFIVAGTTMFAQGMCYTALSRIQSLEQLRVYAPGREQREVFFTIFFAIFTIFSTCCCAIDAPHLLHLCHRQQQHQTPQKNHHHHHHHQPPKQNLQKRNQNH